MIFWHEVEEKNTNSSHYTWDLGRHVYTHAHIHTAARYWIDVKHEGEPQAKFQCAHSVLLKIYLHIQANHRQINKIENNNQNSATKLQYLFAREYV